MATKVPNRTYIDRAVPQGPLPDDLARAHRNDRRRIADMKRALRQPAPSVEERRRSRATTG
jgi:hypothetical protein